MSWKKVLISGDLSHGDIKTGGANGRFLGITGSALSWGNPLTASGETNFTRLALTSQESLADNFRCVGYKSIVANMVSVYDTENLDPAVNSTLDWKTWTSDPDNTNFTTNASAQYLEQQYDAVFAKYTDTNDNSGVLAPHGLTAGQTIYLNFTTVADNHVGEFSGLWIVRLLDNYFFCIKRQGNDTYTVDNRYANTDSEDSALEQVCGFTETYPNDGNAWGVDDHTNPDDRAVVYSAGSPSTITLREGTGTDSLEWLLDFNTIRFDGNPNRVTATITGNDTVFGGPKIELNTPQDIDTAAGVSFGSLKISKNNKIELDKTGSNTAFIQSLTGSPTNLLISAPQTNAAISLTATTVAVSNDLTVANDLTVTGNLDVDGTATYFNTTNMLIKDKTISMGYTGVINTTSSYPLVANGTGYSLGTYSLTGGTGSGAQVQVTNLYGSGLVIGGTWSSGGTGYSIGDVLTIDGGDSNSTATLTEVNFTGSVTDANLSGAGISLIGDDLKEFTYLDSLQTNTGGWHSNQSMDIASGKSYMIDDVKALSRTALMLVNYKPTPSSSWTSPLGIVDTTPNTSAGWTASTSYSGVEQSNTTGSGIDMTCNIAVDSSGSPEFTIVAAGSGHVHGDNVSFLEPGLSSTTVTIELEKVIVIYSTVEHTSTTGSGSGLECTITVDTSGNPAFVITNDGSGYKPEDTALFTDPGIGSDTATITLDSRINFKNSSLAHQDRLYFSTEEDQVLGGQENHPYIVSETIGELTINPQAKLIMTMADFTVNNGPLTSSLSTFGNLTGAANQSHAMTIYGGLKIYSTYDAPGTDPAGAYLLLGARENSSGNDRVKIQAPVTMSNWTLTLPDDYGNAGDILETTDAGVLSWVAPSGGNVSTALSIGTVNTTTYGITSDGAADDIVLPEATTTTAGLLGADKWDEIVANTTHTASTHAPVGAIENISEDLSPELGGELDCGAHSIGFTKQAETGSVGDHTIDWKLGNKYEYTFSLAAETFIFTDPSKPCNLLLLIKQDAAQGSKTATFPASVQWAGGGTAPTLSTAINAVDIISFYFDGTNYYGTASLDFS